MSDHFIETNIVVAHTVDWDSLRPIVAQYIEEHEGEVDTHTSVRVLDEAEDVVNDRRRVAKQAARLIFQNFQTGSRDPPVDQIVGFVRSELNHVRDSVVNHVIQHIRDHEYYYSGLTQTDSGNALASTNGDIDDDFDEPIKEINAIRRADADLQCAVFSNILSDYSTYAEYSDVNGVLSDSPNDRDILFDSYHLTQETDVSNIHMVTMDGDLLDNKSALESYLSTVTISDPRDLCSS
jgi:hypothetical protein